ncbi:hypothetical protein [Pelagibaculum spongiae]|nr:hypothetical protein [Pelagibaculum spongiae]
MKSFMEGFKPSKALLDDLGSMSDFKVAAKHQVRPVQVKELREERKIPTVNQHIVRKQFEWRDKSNKLLGTMTDKALAAKLRITKSMVWEQRKRLGIAPVEPLPMPEAGYHPIKHEWNDRKDALLGTDYDTVIGKRLGINPLRVTYRRNQMGIEPYIRCDRIEWTDDMLEFLGEVPDVDFADYYEISPRTAYLKRVILRIRSFETGHMPKLPDLSPKALVQLGIMNDVAIAAKFDTTRFAVRINREYRGIPIAPRELGPNQFKWNKRDLARIGKIPDKELALKLGVTRQQVTYKRRQLNIPVKQLSQPIEWDDLKLGQLGRTQDAMLAQMWKGAIGEIIAKRESLGIKEYRGPRKWFKKELKLLGTASDEEVGIKVGISATAVRNKRNSLNIAPFKPVKKVKWSKKHLAMIGTMPDAELAYIMKVHPSSVAKKRVELKIKNVISGMDSYR